MSTLEMRAFCQCVFVGFLFFFSVFGVIFGGKGLWDGTGATARGLGASGARGVTPTSAAHLGGLPACVGSAGVKRGMGVVWVCLKALLRPALLRPALLRLALLGLTLLRSFTLLRYHKNRIKCIQNINIILLNLRLYYSALLYCSSTLILYTSFYSVSTINIYPDFLKNCKMTKNYSTHFDGMDYYFCALSSPISLIQFTATRYYLRHLSTLNVYACKLIQNFFFIRLAQNPKTTSKSSAIILRIKIRLNNYPQQQINVTARTSVTYSKVLEVIRKRLNVTPTTALFLYAVDSPVTPCSVWTSGRVRLVCIGENQMGGEQLNTDEDTAQGNGKNTPFRNRRSKNSPKNLAKNCSYECSLLYSNTNGLTRDKVEAIRQEAVSDKYIAGTEWNKTPDETARVVDFFGKFGILKSCHKFTYHNGKRIPIDKKKKGYGTGIISKDHNTLEGYETGTPQNDFEFEILPCILTVGCEKLGMVLVYRSPSMTAANEIEAFYAEIATYISNMRGDSRLSGVLYIGDPNTASSKLGSSIEKSLLEQYGLVDLIEGMPTRAGSETQPDSCYAWFDCSRVSCDAEVIGRIHHKMDHRAIRVRLRVNSVPPVLPEYKEVTYKRRKTEIKDTDIDAMLREKFSIWQSKYKTLIYDVAGVERDTTPGDSLVDKATNDFLGIIKDVKDAAWETVTAKWPVNVPKHSDNISVQIGQISAKLSALSYKIRNEGQTTELLTKFRELEKEKLDLLKTKVRDRIELCMSHQLNKANARNTDHLFKWTKKLLSREGFQKTLKDKLTDEQIKEKVKECDDTFTNLDPQYSPNLQSFSQIAPEFKFNVDAWNPVGQEVDYLAEYISKKKKLDPFYKHHAYTLSNPTFILLKLIEKSDYFPEVLRYSKLTVLPSRFIFSLDALPKVVESILAIEFNSCMQKDYEKNGDPEQMAYEENRGTTACNAITFTHVDINLSSGNTCIQSFLDIRKAFNVMNRETMLKAMQRIAGAGRLIYTRFLNRTYIAPDGIHYGQGHNTGVDAGCPIPVCAFKAGINTDVNLTGLNKALDWASLYSDDRSALAKSAAVLQAAITASLSWASSRFIKYHDGVTCCLEKAVSKCKKFPALLIYKRRGMSVPEDYYSIKLGEIPFKVTNYQRSLGLNVYTDETKLGYKDILGKQGYFFIPEIGRIKSLAYRMQQIKFDFIPHFLKTMILCYFCGIINNAACLYWLRSKREDLNTLRFYYAMGISAVVGETAMGTLGASCCRNMSVTTDNMRMKKLLEMVGVKSLEEIAMTDAVATVKQVEKLRPQWFQNSSGSRRRHKPERLGISDSLGKFNSISHEAVDKAELPTVLSDEVVKSNALIGDVWRLAVRKVISDFEKRKLKSSFVFKHKFEELWLLSEQVCNDEADGKEVKTTHVMSTYHLLCKDHLGTIDAQTRRLERLTVSRPLQPNHICEISPPIWNRRKIRSSNFRFGCRVAPPQTGNGVSNPCVVCGYSVPIVDTLSKKCGSCSKCKRSAHLQCCERLLLKKNFFCDDVPRFLGANGIELVCRSGPKKRPINDRSRCLVCGDSVDLNRVDCCCEDCDYGAHEVCANLAMKMSARVPNLEKFRCKDVSYYLKPSEVESVISNPDFDLQSLMKRRGRICPKSYTPKRKRYRNPDIECEYCGELIGINDTEHVLAHCSASFAGTPVPTRDRQFVFMKLKRIRRLALNDYPP